MDSVQHVVIYGGGGQNFDRNMLAQEIVAYHRNCPLVVISYFGSYRDAGESTY